MSESAANMIHIHILNQEKKKNQKFHYFTKSPKCHSVGVLHPSTNITIKSLFPYYAHIKSCATFQNMTFFWKTKNYIFSKSTKRHTVRALHPPSNQEINLPLSYNAHVKGCAYFPKLSFFLPPKRHIL